MSKYDPPSEPPDGDPVCKRCDTPMLDGYAGLNVRQHDWYCPNEDCPHTQQENDMSTDVKMFRIHWKLSNGRKFVSPPLLQLATQQMSASLELDDDVVDIRIEEVADEPEQEEG